MLYRIMHIESLSKSLYVREGAPARPPPPFEHILALSLPLGFSLLATP